MLMSIGFFAIFQTFGSLNYSEVFSLVPFINETAITIIALFLLGGALAKSANIPLHSWLPGSMEAPTPVSALLHAATLVTAGIYLLIRVSPILEYSSTTLLIITIIGSSTAFFAGTCGLLQNDLKRIIAFSTISQLGYSILLLLLFFVLELDTASPIWFNNFSNISTIFLPLLSASSKQRQKLKKPIIPLFGIFQRTKFFVSVRYYVKNAKVCANIKNTTPLLKQHHKAEEKLKKSSLETQSVKDKFNSSIKYLDRYDDFSFNNRKMIKEKYYNKRGIYLWVNKINNKSYVGKSVNLYSRLNKNYLSSSYILKNKDKMSICAAIFKYGIENFSFFVLEVVEKKKEDIETSLTKEFLSHLCPQTACAGKGRENYWHSIINPSYNIAAILKPFTGINHYRFGKILSDSLRMKISKSLKGRTQSDLVKANHVLGARKKKFIVMIGILKLC